MKSLYFNGKNSLEDLGIFMLSNYEIPTAQEIIENISIDGRKTGTLTRRTGTYKDLEIEREFVFVDMLDYKQKIIKISDWLENIQDSNLWFDDDLGKCYIVKNVICSSFTNKNQHYIKFSVKFICEPFAKIRNDYFIAVNNGDSIVNDGAVICEPIIRFKAPNKGNIQITINNNTFVINDAVGDVVIDSNLFMVMNEYGKLKSSGIFPQLEKGENIIEWVGNLEKFEIQKRILYRG